ncbi:MAG TPA: hypothetical protein VIX18_06430 [Nitrospirota bacterium]
MDAKQLKKISEQFSLHQIEACIKRQAEQGENECGVVDDTTDEALTALSKAEVVRELMDKGMTFTEALRELGKRIRAIYGKD